MKLVSGDSLSIQDKVNDIEESYARSCEHNGTTQDNMRYFREYVFFCMAIQSETMSKILAKLEQ